MQELRHVPSAAKIRMKRKITTKPKNFTENSAQSKFKAYIEAIKQGKYTMRILA